MRRKLVLWILFVLFLVMNSLYLNRVPGLMGDEASEGQNVFELLESETWTIRGERSYIGPLIDYARVPFVQVFGYTVLALRIPLLLFSIATFWLAVIVFKRLFGEETYLMAVAALVFSPVYLTYQRLGWAITLFPFFALLILYLLTSGFKQRALLAGLAGGLGVHTHILFLPVLVGIGGSWLIAKFKEAWGYWPAVVGFLAAFGTQIAILLLYPEDQGDPMEVAGVLLERVYDLPKILPLVLSGSSFVARYTGVEFSDLFIWLVTGIVAILAAVALILPKNRKAAGLWFLGAVVSLGVLLVIMDRFTLRYFVMLCLALWTLAGVGLAKLIKFEMAPVGLAVLLSGLSWGLIFIPFLKTGGSVADFSLGNRTNSAAALVDTRPLLVCLRGAGSVTSEDVHIFNRLLYFSHEYEDLKVLPDSEAKLADFLVHHKTPKILEEVTGEELCPELKHFVVEKQS